MIFCLGQKLLLWTFLTHMGNCCACWRRPDDILHRRLAVLQSMLPPRGVVQPYGLRAARGALSAIAINSCWLQPEVWFQVRAQATQPVAGARCKRLHPLWHKQDPVGWAHSLCSTLSLTLYAAAGRDA
jgi:hypothetical protein